jgi:hypothetical protein
VIITAFLAPIVTAMPTVTGITAVTTITWSSGEASRR